MTDWLVRYSCNLIPHSTKSRYASIRQGSCQALEAVQLHYQAALPRLLSSAASSLYSLAVKAQPHEWHGIAGCSETAPKKPLPSQEMDSAFGTRYSTVFSRSNNTEQQCSGNLMTHSSDCLRICCHAVAQTAAGVWKHHWVSLHLLLLSAQKDKPVFPFLFILLVHLPFMKKKPSSFFWCHRPGTLLLASAWASRDQGQKLQHSVH